VQRSSETIGAIATALAKAQSELTNPEKSLVATIRPLSPRDAERTFRYASLSSGLDIVRKSLGKHEIAIVQTTTIDKDARLVRLTTILAHSSGEWMSSEWPVCPIAETGSPQRMGAALTYARRYALFTLVGIAGEDDLDSPDLVPGAAPALDHGDTGLPLDSSIPSRWTRNGHAARRSTTGQVRPAPLEPGASSVLRDTILAEIKAFTAAEYMASWARARLPAKNSLTAADAKLVEEAFERRLSELVTPDTTPALNGRAADEPSAPQQDRPATVAAVAIDATAVGAEALGAEADGPMRIDKSALAIAEPRRYRNKEHLRFVAAQACLVCGRTPCDPHHLRFMQPRALGRKVSDEFTVPLCRGHHRAVHGVGDERAWWQKIGIDPVTIAASLWQQTRQPRQRRQRIAKSVPTERA